MSIFDPANLPAFSQDNYVSIDDANDIEMLNIPKMRDQMIRRLPLASCTDPVGFGGGIMTYFNKRQPMEQSLPPHLSEAPKPVVAQEGSRSHGGYQPLAVRLDWR